MDKKRVLIVEDEAAIAKLVALIVAELDVEVDIAANGAEALQKIGRRKPDMLILDLIMPVMNGEELIQEVQANPETADIRIALMTTRQAAKGYKRDAFPLISKPFEPLQVKEVVRQVLALGDVQ